MSVVSSSELRGSAHLSEVLRGMLAGRHTVVLPQGPGGAIRVALPEQYDPAATGRPHPALVLYTSGSTGKPKAVALSSRALIASARATERFLSGPGRWYLTLPTHHIAGIQVLLRSLLAGTAPVTAAGRFTAAGFAADVGRLLREDPPAGSPIPLYTSLVPTQLVRIMADPAAVRAARAFDAVLLGGAAISPALLAAAHAAGIRIVRTYGMSETCGGCVYDGTPFDGVGVHITGTGTVVLAGSVLADGYLQVEEPAEAPAPDSSPAPGAGSADPDPPALHLTALPDEGTGFGAAADGTRSFLTSDLGRMEDGVLEILGRADDVIITGGENVSPLAVENALLGVLEPHGIAEVLVTSVPDAEWGERLVALLRPAPSDLHPPAGASGTADLTALVREWAAGAVGRHQLPRAVLLVDALPTASIGKPDRAAARTLAARLLAPRTHAD